MNRVRHYYSKMNPFNADETRAILFSGDGGKHLYDTRSWKPIEDLRVASSDPEIQWHPSDPNLFYYLDFENNSPNVRAMYRYDIRTDRRVLLRDFSEYETARVGSRAIWIAKAATTPCSATRTRASRSRPSCTTCATIASAGVSR